jgi:putative phosphoribosyl transferase
VYRGNLNWPRFKADNVILIDDGLATGYSMRVAIEAARNLDAKKIIVAVPVAPEDTLQDISALVDETICLETPEQFRTIGKWYEEFNQVTDEEVHRLLQISWGH